MEIVEGFDRDKNVSDTRLYDVYTRATSPRTEKLQSYTVRRKIIRLFEWIAVTVVESTHAGSQDESGDKCTASL